MGGCPGLARGWRLAANMICGCAMALVPRLLTLQFWPFTTWRYRALSLKAMTFAFVGVINTLVDYSMFLLARLALTHSGGALAFFDSVSVSCRCAEPSTVGLVAANMMSWSVAITGSYMMNSSITFAAESGRKLRWRAYFTFVASGILGWIANTATLVFAAQVLLLPVWLAKAIAILASFVVNFSMSHFVVFRVRHRPAIDIGKDA
jgi:putative flippase GtrA